MERRTEANHPLSNLMEAGRGYVECRSNEITATRAPRLFRKIGEVREYVGSISKCVGSLCRSWFRRWFRRWKRVGRLNKHQAMSYHCSQSQVGFNDNPNACVIRTVAYLTVKYLLVHEVRRAGSSYISQD